jgi:isocitrate dehydrogenase
VRRPRLRFRLLQKRGVLTRRASLFRNLAGAEKITTVQEAADLITQGISAAIAHGEVTYDLARMMEPRVEPLSCSGFAEAVVRRFS